MFHKKAQELKKLSAFLICDVPPVLGQGDKVIKFQRRKEPRRGKERKYKSQEIRYSVAD